MLDSLSARLRGETAQRVVPARGTASAAGGGGGADETTPREVVHLRQLTAQIKKEKHEASAARVKLELDIRGAVRELCQSKSHADAQETDCSARLSLYFSTFCSIDSFGVGSHKVKALLAVTEECGSDVSVGFGNHRCNCNLTQTLQRPPFSWRHWSEWARIFLGTTCSTSDASLSTSVNSSSSASSSGSSSAWAVRSSTDSRLRSSNLIIWSSLIWYGSGSSPQPRTPDTRRGRAWRHIPVAVDLLL